MYKPTSMGCMSRSSHTHWTAVKYVLCYLQGMPTLGITPGRDDNLKPSAFCDADWAAAFDRRSVSGYAFKLAGGLVSWNSKKEPAVALSTMEAEYITLAHTAKEAIWLRNLITELGFSTDDATTIFSDNQSAITFAHDSQFHARSKHIDIRHHFIRERITSGEIAVSFCASEDNCADMLTKALARLTHETQLALNDLSAG